METVVCPDQCVVHRYWETAQGLVPLSNAEHNETKKNIEIMGSGNIKKQLTAAEQRFANEIAVLMNMSLTELLLVEQTRKPIGI